MTLLPHQALGCGVQPALLVVDASVGFTDPGSPLGTDASAVVTAIGELLAAFRARGLPVFFTTVAYDSPGQAEVFRQKLPVLNVLKTGSSLVQIDPRIAPQDGESVLAKHFVSAFFDTDLRQRLQERGVDTLYVTGFSTSGCVRASAVDGLQCNLRVVIAREAVGDRDTAAHEANLHDLGCKYADVVSLKDALSLLAPR